MCGAKLARQELQYTKLFFQKLTSRGSPGISQLANSQIRDCVRHEVPPARHVYHTVFQAVNNRSGMASHVFCEGDVQNRVALRNISIISLVAFLILQPMYLLRYTLGHHHPIWLAVNKLMFRMRTITGLHHEDECSETACEYQVDVPVPA